MTDPLQYGQDMRTKSGSSVAAATSTVGGNSKVSFIEYLGGTSFLKWPVLLNKLASCILCSLSAFYYSLEMIIRRL